VEFFGSATGIIQGKMYLKTFLYQLAYID